MPENEKKRGAVWVAPSAIEQLTRNQSRTMVRGRLIPRTMIDCTSTI